MGVNMSQDRINGALQGISLNELGYEGGVRNVFDVVAPCREEVAVFRPAQ